MIAGCSSPAEPLPYSPTVNCCAALRQTADFSSREFPKVRRIPYMRRGRDCRRLHRFQEAATMFLTAGQNCLFFRTENFFKSEIGNDTVPTAGKRFGASVGLMIKSNVYKLQFCSHQAGNYLLHIEIKKQLRFIVCII